MQFTVNEIRRQNLKDILSDCKMERISAKRFAEIAGTTGAYLSQILSSKTRGVIGSALARKIEIAAKKPVGWLDQSHEMYSDKIEVQAFVNSMLELIQGFIAKNIAQ